MRALGQLGTPSGPELTSLTHWPRAVPPRPRGPRPPSRPRRRVAAPRGPTPGPYREPCTLYPSDAADDPRRLDYVSRLDHKDNINAC